MDGTAEGCADSGEKASGRSGRRGNDGNKGGWPMARLHTQFVKASNPVSQVEQDIDHYITVHSDGVYDEVLTADSRWEVFFHLSEMRWALFGWYDMPKNADVLEIGCGFGALTGVLAERAAHVIFRAVHPVCDAGQGEGIPAAAGNADEIEINAQKIPVCLGEETIQKVI